MNLPAEPANTVKTSPPALCRQPSINAMENDYEQHP